MQDRVQLRERGERGEERCACCCGGVYSCVLGGVCVGVCTLCWPHIRPPPIQVGAATPFKPAVLRFFNQFAYRLSVSCVVFELFFYRSQLSLDNLICIFLSLKPFWNLRHCLLLACYS